MVKHSGALGIRRNGRRQLGTAREIAARADDAAKRCNAMSDRIIALEEALRDLLHAQPALPDAPLHEAIKSATRTLTRVDA